MKWKKDNVAGFVIVHALAGLAAVPWFFSWTGVLLFVAGLFLFGMFGINLGYHRLLTHRSLACPLCFGLARAVVLPSPAVTAKARSTPGTAATFLRDEA